MTIDDQLEPQMTEEQRIDKREALLLNDIFKDAIGDMGSFRVEVLSFKPVAEKDNVPDRTVLFGVIYRAYRGSRSLGKYSLKTYLKNRGNGNYELMENLWSDKIED